MKLNAINDAISKHNSGVITITNILGKNGALISDITRDGNLSVVNTENSTIVNYTRPSGTTENITNINLIDRIVTTKGVYQDDADGVTNATVVNDQTTTTPNATTSGSAPASAGTSTTVTPGKSTTVSPTATIVNVEPTVADDNLKPYSGGTNNGGNTNPTDPEDVYEMMRLEELAKNANWSNDRISDEDYAISNLHKFLVSNSTNGLILDMGNSTVPDPSFDYDISNDAPGPKNPDTTSTNGSIDSGNTSSTTPSITTPASSNANTTAGK